MDVARDTGELQCTSDAIKRDFAAGGADGSAIDLAIFQFDIATNTADIHLAGNTVELVFPTGGVDCQPAGEVAGTHIAANAGQRHRAAKALDIDLTASGVNIGLAI